MPHEITEESMQSGAIEEFIGRWENVSGTEKANYQLFLTELCTLLALPQPDPASNDNEQNAYVFERRVDISKADGSVNRGFIDLYRRGAFVLEAKQTGKALETQGWDKAMLAAQNQADQYVRALPGDEGRPPFIVVTDVGRSLELYSEFTRSGGTYVPYPDPSSHRIRVEDLRDPDIRERLRQLWLDPDALDPSKRAAKVTRQISDKLAQLARSLEQSGYDVERVAHFLKRCLFTMFCEDVELLPQDSFTNLLQRLEGTPEHFPDSMRSLWSTMNTGGFEGQLMAKLQRFNGGLFASIDPIPLTSDQIGMLVEAAKADWRFVEPAIFGTLLERALDPRERHKLGAHYTPRAYVERLVMPTLIEPLREEWSTVQVAAETWIQQDKTDKALKELQAFHYKLCQVRVLDPACGSGNFLYVALEHMKRLEGEVLNTIRDLSAGQQAMDTEGLTVDPHQFLGMEINPRAAAIAEVVLWIGYLQWHYRLYGKLNLPEPILRDFKNIECRDALIEYDSREPMLDEDGQPKTIWDGISFKTSAATGELVPDDAGRTPVYHFIRPRKTKWPKANYIVGNPPFIGKLKIRDALGIGYVDALREAYKGEVPDSCDLVMYWWHIAAENVRVGVSQRFGLITTNSLRQGFNRRVLESHLNRKNKPLMLSFVIPDHPWVDSNDGAAVRISMSVTKISNSNSGELCKVVSESRRGEETRDITFSRTIGQINPDLTVGANISTVATLQANSKVSTTGVIPHGKGMILNTEQAKALGDSTLIKPYRNGKDLTARPRGAKVIDCYGLEIDQVRTRHPAVYQWLLDRVKPERDVNKDKDLREKWWLHRRNNEDMRTSLSGLERYIATVMTAKHRLFQFLDSEVLPDQMLVSIALPDPYQLGILCSRIHVAWALAAGGTLEDRPRYNKIRCFETFPFPELPDDQANTIGELARQIDNHRKRQQSEHEKLTLTGMYNVLEKLRAEEPLTSKDKTIHEQGLISVLRELHDELDTAVFEAYGWSDLGKILVGRPGATTPLSDKPAEQAEAEEELLCRLVALNHQRAAEEAQGHIRWLRPDYQAPDSQQSSAKLDIAADKPAEQNSQAGKKETWPKDIPAQVEAVRKALAIGPQTDAAIAAQFKRIPLKGVGQILEALAALGHVSKSDDIWQLAN
ncbi:class I SAM-dependent DNA methyltransferase [Spongiibacter nanhainus]|uniref:site-specific DNA-methyltransferase (adenine-specific) n=1 Tax=Spongiibacter nanhainus TaxID=2794344 RepID=A0A7T4UP49_9GAMM|nr:class I SAM-dependent DNA methyltransferase [Spongiibacter nanhainus]QQD16658.1 class I SAM-dependent DNA methyltransferase [Spongiibacter nanhainus]